MIKKLLLLIPVLFLLFVSLTFGVDSTDRSRYYNDSVNIITDNIEDAGNERALNGSLVIDGDDADSSTNWAQEIGSTGPKCNYTNGESYKGDIAINCTQYTGGGDDTRSIDYDIVDNATFSGKFDAWVYASSVGGSGSLSFGFKNDSSSSFSIFIHSGSPNWRCSKPGSLDCNVSVAFVANTWTNLIFNFTYPTGEVQFWIGNTLVQTVNSTGISFISFRNAVSSNRISLIDNIAIYNEDRPQVDTIPPSVNITNINASDTIKLNDVLNISCFAQDNLALSKGNITFNVTGPDSLYNFSFEFSGGSAVYSQNITINLTRGNVINATCGVTDDVGNTNTNGTLITIGNAVPSAPTIILPTPNDYNNTQPIPS